MESHNALAVAAMDGQVIGEKQRSTNITDNDRDEPTALFYTVYGLVYEALASSSADAVPSAQLRHNAIVSLRALKNLVRPEYSGKALLETTIFEEFSSLCYRMAMTESSTVLIHLVDVLASLCVSQKSMSVTKSVFFFPAFVILSNVQWTFLGANRRLTLSFLTLLSRDVSGSVRISSEVQPWVRTRREQVRNSYFLHATDYDVCSSWRR